MINQRIKILQLFAKYLNFGGEEGSVYRVAEHLRTRYDVNSFIATTEELLAGGFLQKLQVPFKAYRNHEVMARLKTTQENGGYDCWQIHNVFPSISAGAYQLADELNVPIIHYLHNYRMGCVNGFAFTKGKNCEKCFHGDYYHGAIGKCWRESHAQSAMMALLLAEVRRMGVFEQVRRWVAISHDQKQAHVEMGIPADKIDVVYHFLDAPCDTSESESFPDQGYGLFIGRLSPEKGVDHLLDAWALLEPSHRLVIAGDGPEKSRLEKKAEDLQLTNVTFTGFVKKEDQKTLWQGAAFSIVPSLWREPFGMVVLEAWAQKRAVVAHSIGALTELVSDGVNGFLADAESSSDLARVLSKAFSARDDLRDMGLHGAKTLTEEFNKTVWMERISQVYQKADLHL